MEDNANPGRGTRLLADALAFAAVANLVPLALDAAARSAGRLAWTICLSVVLAAASAGLRLARRRVDAIAGREAARMEMILALHREIENAEFDVEEVVLWLLDRARTLLGASAASAGIVEGDVIAYRYRTGPGMNSGVVIRTPRAGSLSGVCLETGEPVYCSDSETDPRVDRAACRAQNLRSMIIVPLRRNGADVGVMNVNSPNVAAFGPDDIRTVRLVGGAIAAAYGHAVDLAAKRALLDDLRASESQLSHLAMHDSLTGLPNRRLFLERLGVALAERGEVRPAVLFLDLDGFKAVNDTLGHEAGDTLLTTVAQRVTGVLRNGETAARLGGDEFAILCKGLSPQYAAVRVAQRILEALARPLRESEGTLTASIGIATTGARAEDLLRNADAAMYQAKASGKAGYAIYEPDARAA